MLGQAPLGRVPVQRAHQRGLAGQVPDEHPQPPRRQQAAVVVEQVDPVEPEQVGFDGLAVLAQERVEAEDSPSAIPVSRP
ncbi:hypothetical protein Amsp01_095600 [Amycolatopsis sp. NBRC 101858]|nr:hypothetical protein Amsp01_095600 [Amycolatopsis sp. NBRC 101858]